MANSILIVCNSFYPEQSPRAFRATELAKEFRRRNIDVVVMCPDKTDLTIFLKQWDIRHISLGSLNWSIKNFKVKNRLFEIINRTANRLLPKLFEFPMIELFFKVNNKLRETSEKYDAIISIAVPYPIHWGVARAWSKNNNQNIASIWIADCGDPYYIQQNDTIKTPFYFKWVEQWFMRKVDFITVPTSSAHFGYLPEFYNKLRVIPQGFKFEDVIQKQKIDDGILRFAYAGGFTVLRRDPTGLLDYLTNLSRDIKYEFHIYTRNIHFVEKYALKDNRVKVHGFKPRLELLSELSQFDFMINLENFGEAQSPSKLIDYGIIGKPILSLKSFDLDIENLQNFLCKDYTNAFLIKNLEDYRIENVVNSFIDLMVDNR
jgi:hypothetical protein